jgi:hypothetical protein
VPSIGAQTAPSGHIGAKNCSEVKIGTLVSLHSFMFDVYRAPRPPGGDPSWVHRAPSARFMRAQSDCSASGPASTARRSRRQRVAAVISALPASLALATARRPRQDRLRKVVASSLCHLQGRHAPSIARFLSSHCCCDWSMYWRFRRFSRWRTNASFVGGRLLAALPALWGQSRESRLSVSCSCDVCGAMQINVTAYVVG